MDVFTAFLERLIQSPLLTAWPRSTLETRVLLFTGRFIPIEKTSSVRGGERDRPSRTRYEPIPGRLVADIRVGEQSGKACRTLRWGRLGYLNYLQEKAVDCPPNRSCYKLLPH